MERTLHSMLLEENLGAGTRLSTGMEQIKPSASRLIASLLFAGVCVTATAQSTPNDGIDRNLLQREQRSSDFHVRLYDGARAAGQDALLPLPPVPHSFVGSELYQVPSAGASSGVGNVGTPSADAANRQQLDDSQLRRQLELQTQNKIFDEATRQQQSQIQQLQFGRENQAQQLQQQIQRDSSNLMQRTH